MSKETEMLKQSLRLQHKRPDVDDIVASFIRPSASYQAESASIAAAPAAEKPDLSAPPAGTVNLTPAPAETETAEPEPALRVHPEPAPATPARRTSPRHRVRQPKPKLTSSVSTTSIPLVSNIPTRAFFRYYNLCQDEVLRRIPSKTGKLLLSRLFRLSFGFNRNWCRVSMESLANHVGAEQTNHVRATLKGELAEWVHLLAKGDRRGPSLWGLAFGDMVTPPWEIDGAKLVSEADTYEHHEIAAEDK